MNLNLLYFLISQNISTDLKGPKVNINCTMVDVRGRFLGLPHDTTKIILYAFLTWPHQLPVFHEAVVYHITFFYILKLLKKELFVKLFNTLYNYMTDLSNLQSFNQLRNACQ